MRGLLYHTSFLYHPVPPLVIPATLLCHSGPWHVGRDRRAVTRNPEKYQTIFVDLFVYVDSGSEAGMTIKKGRNDKEICRNANL